MVSRPVPRTTRKYLGPNAVFTLKARFPLKHFAAAGEKSRQINLFFYSFAAGETIPAFPVVENAQLLLKEQLTTAKEQREFVREFFRLRRRNA